MRSLLRELLALALWLSGLPLLVRQTIARRRATLVVYHDPTPERFERHLRYLAKRYSFITLDRLVEAIRTQDWSIPKHPLVITFDDGHRGNHRLKPLFERYGVRPTLYLASRVVQTRRHFWFRHVGWAQSLSLMNLPERDRLDALRERYAFAPTTEYPEESRHALSGAELADLAECVDFGSHSCFHANLTTCSEEECERELRDSKQDLERMLGRECRHFSYPNGDYSEREIELAREAGYLSARTVDVGWNGPGADPYRLRVTGVTDDASIPMLAAQLSGITMYLRYLRAGSLWGRHRVVHPHAWASDARRRGKVRVPSGC
jgi:peptidoglycan/xylan/chitin deacetylase (PgdA/CDA1 family)